MIRHFNLLKGEKILNSNKLKSNYINILKKYFFIKKTYYFVKIIINILN
jgi:hypothetical protein